MKVIGKICMALVMIAGLAFAPGPHNIVLYIETPGNEPIAGAEFKCWDITSRLDHTDYLDESSFGTTFIDQGTFWVSFFDIANFGGGGTYDDWQHGDTLCILGSWTEDEGTVTHSGYYWLFSDTVTGTAAPDFFTPNDTLREMPMPVASPVFARQDTVDSILIEIVNPPETESPPFPYDLMGYWIVCDTTGTGIESFFDVDLGFVPITGGPDSSTFFQYSLADILPVGLQEYDLYHAYYMVARPETTVIPGMIPGFSTDAMSMNSNLLTVVGVAEHENTVPTSFSARPSVFTDRTRFSVVMPEQALVNIKLYNAAGQHVATVCDEVLGAGAHTLDYDGTALASGVYFYTLKTGKEQLSGQLVKLR